MAYKILTGMTFPASPEEVKKCLAGKEFSTVEYAAGDVVDWVPAESEKWLVADGHVEKMKEEVKDRGKQV
jgi:hypothetical protein